MNQDAPSKADDLVLLINIFSERREAFGLTVAEIQALAGWSNQRTISRILDLGGRVRHETERVKGIKITRYTLKVD